MSLRRPTSLKWLLIGRLAVAQGMVLAILLGLNSVVMSIMWVNGSLGSGYNRATLDAVRDAVSRDSNGRLMVRFNPVLMDLQAHVSDLWFVVQDTRGERIVRGTPPPEVASILPQLGRIDDASISRRMGGNLEPAGIIQRSDSAAGTVWIVADVRGAVSLVTVYGTVASTMGVVLFVIGIMVITTLLVTPFVVRGALSGLSDVAAQAARIDLKRSGIRLSEANVPGEVAPLVTAINDALARLDRDYERHRRFLTDAAHELRTPISILSTRIAGLPKGSERTRLLEDTTRLTTLASQLLDLQRLEQPQHIFVDVDLAKVVKRVVLDLAPLAFAAGYEIAFDAAPVLSRVHGDEGAIERAVTNLVQNAIDYGGRRGEITVDVLTPAIVQVCDQGDGIAPDEHERVFEPFHRLVQGGRGAGLGLDLVQRTMRIHGGSLEIGTAEAGGARLCLIFPPESIGEAAQHDEVTMI